MVCRASSGPDAPPVGARLQVGSGFSGECVKTGTLLRCNDTEADSRVDRENCRALGIRSMLAVPAASRREIDRNSRSFLRPCESFFRRRRAVLQRLAQAVLAAVNRALRVERSAALQPAPPATAFAPQPGSVLFASVPKRKNRVEITEEKTSSGISLPRSHLILLVCAAAAIAMVLGYNLAPLIRSELEQRARTPYQTVWLRLNLRSLTQRRLPPPP